MNNFRSPEARNKAVVERYFREVLDPRKIDTLPELMAPDVVLHRPGFAVMGVDSAMDRLRSMLRNFVAFHSEVNGLIAEDDLVSVRVTHITRVRPHMFRSRAGELWIDKEQDLTWTAIAQFRLRGGMIVEEWVMRDELGMLAQLGAFPAGK